MIKKISIPYFHIGVKLTTPLIFGAGIYLIIIQHPVWGVILFLVATIILTTKYVTEFNLKGKYVKDYVFFLGLSIDEDLKRVERLDRIVITKGDYSQMINTRSRSHQLDWVDYSATLLFDNDSITLLTKNERQDLLTGIKEFAEYLQVKVEDRTTHQYYWIDLNKAQDQS